MKDGRQLFPDLPMLGEKHPHACDSHTPVGRPSDDRRPDGTTCLPAFPDVLPVLRQRWPQLRTCTDERPLFLFACGHRSGSTLFQRMLVRGCWLWGEPYGEGMLFEGVTRLLRTLREDWPPAGFMDDAFDTDADLAATWIANRYPPLQALADATVGYLLTLLRDPAMRHGRRRWGCKEIRYGADMAYCLKWLFPKAQFLFLIRNPYDCFRSYQRIEGTWHLRWPDRELARADQFGAHWLSLAKGFLEHAAALDALVVRYEDLVRPRFDPRPIEDYLGFTLDCSALEHRLSGGTRRIQPLDNATQREEMAALHATVGRFAAQLGYPPPPEL